MIQNAIQNYGASAYLYLIGLLFAGVIAFEMLTGQPVNQLATGYIGLVIGYAINSHGITQGVNTTNDTVAKTAIAQQPLIALQEKRTAASEAEIASNTDRLDVLENPPKEGNPTP